MLSKYSPLVCHFHYCDTLRWLHIKEVLQQLMLTRVSASTEFFTFHLSSETFDALTEFIREMDTAYIHPRRDSFHVSLCAITYSDFRVPGSYLNKIPNVKKVEILPNQEREINLSQTA